MGMVQRVRVTFGVVSLSACLGALALEVPLLSEGTSAALRPVATPGVALAPVSATAGRGVQFTKDGVERRFLGWSARVDGLPTGLVAAEMALRFETMDTALRARSAVILYQEDGIAWVCVGAPLASGRGDGPRRLSLASRRPAAFSRGAPDDVAWQHVDRAWFGVVIDGAGQGELQVEEARLTDTHYVPTKPAPILRADPEAWTVAADSAVTHAMTRVELPEDGAVLRSEFTFPGGRHMYYVPSQGVPEVALAAYAGLRLQYRANLPAGIDGLLVSLHEGGGGQYCAEPPPPASGDGWTTHTIPWTAFVRAAWAKDANDRLDLDRVLRVTVGAHGTARGQGGAGVIELRAVEAVPPQSEPQSK